MAASRGSARKMLATVILPWIFLIPIVICEEPNEFVKNLTKDDFTDFIGAKAVSMVYFKRGSEEESPYKVFKQEYEKAASLLAIYDVKFGQVDCDSVSDKDISHCAIKGIEANVFAFRGGEELLDLSLDTMFDVNSIMSNVLQLVLLREVPIVQKPEELTKLENKMKGKHDIIFSYQSAIGTYEHRILMEVAFAFHDHYMFAITTVKEVVKEISDTEVDGTAAIWVLSCKDTDVADPGSCPHTLYNNTMDLYSLSTYLKLLNTPMKFVHDIVEDGLDVPYTANKIHQVYMYYNAASKEEVKKQAMLLTKAFPAILGVVTVDMDRADEDNLSQGRDPPFAIMRALNQDAVIMTEKFENDAIANFVSTELDKFMHKVDSSSNYVTTDQLEDEEELDDEVADAVYKLKDKEMDLETVPALTDKTFPTATKDAELLFVLFYVTFDPRSMAFLRSYSEMAKQLSGEGLQPYARVDCFDWTDVCKKYNISSYPTLRVYRKGKQPVEYKGLLDGVAVTSAAKMYMAPQPFLLHSMVEAEAFSKGDLPEGLHSHTETAVLGLFSSKASDEIKAFTEAAEQAHGKLAFGLAKDQVATEIAEKYGSQLPSIAVIKRDDPLQPHVLFRQDFTSSRILQFVKDARLPVFPELTSVNFPAYFAKQLPLAIVFTEEVDSGSLMDAVKSVIKSGQFKGISFSYMNLKDNALAKSVLSTYENRRAEMLKIPALAVVNHKRGTVHTYTESDHSQETITTWLKGVQEGEITQTIVLDKKEWKPVNPGYDFLKLIDEDARAWNKDGSKLHLYESVGEYGRALDGEGNEVEERPDGQGDSAENNLEAELEVQIRQELKASRLFRKAAEKKAEVHKHEHTEL